MADDVEPDDVARHAPRRVTDPHTLRAFSHPLRLKLLGELATRSPQNVRMLAERVGEPANSVSYHLAQLANHGLVIRVDGPEGSTRRERWYEPSSPQGYELVIDEDTPDQTATLAALKAWLLQVTADAFDRYAANEPEARRRGLPLGNATTNVWLTEAEAAELRTRVTAVLGPMAARVDEERRARAEGRSVDHEGRVHYTVDLSFFPDFSSDPMQGSIWTHEFDDTFVAGEDGPAG